MLFEITQKQHKLQKRELNYHPGLIKSVNIAKHEEKYKLYIITSFLFVI